MLPVETIRACCPGYGLPRGIVRFRAPTLAHALALESLGVDLDKPFDRTGGLLAAFVLTREPSVARAFGSDEIAARTAFDAWLSALPREANPAALSRQAIETFEAAFSAMIEPKKADGETARVAGKHGRSGLGWPLELAEWYAHEYARPFDEALCEPIARVFACVACARQRNGGKHGGPDYWERIDMKAALAELERKKEA